MLIEKSFLKKDEKSSFEKVDKVPLKKVKPNKTNNLRRFCKFFMT